MADVSKASSSSTPSPGAGEVSPSAVREAMNGVLADTLRPICVGLALFYALISIWYVVDWIMLDTEELAGKLALDFGFLDLSLPEFALRPMSTGIVSLALLAGAFWFERNRLPPAAAHPVATMIGVVVVTNCLILLVLGTEPRQTTNLMIAQIGF